ncbi:DUF559 domain-containing protein [Candidatus Gracilibacteria bacterium]|nr:DUF559 domain-containing protein [Candidatus Gracilibacteria bacterium]
MTLNTKNMTARKIPEILKITARELRQKLTPAEKILWKELRAKKLVGMKFIRQYPTYVFTEDDGLERYVIPDFVCKTHKLIVELDGSIHDLDEIYQLDNVKQELLEAQGYKVLRFKNDAVENNITEVLNTLKNKN